MIDIHCHILPDTDDGAKTVDDALVMARHAVEEGITTIIATPHHRNGTYVTPKATILAKVDELNRQLTAAQIPLTILPGQEPRIFGEVVECYTNGELLSLNDQHQYMLIEFSNTHIPKYAKQLLFNLQQIGIIPIIVHPERNPEIVKNSDILYQFVKAGALVQVTSASVIGKFGKNIQKFTLQLIEHHLAHFIASDAHNITSRSFHLREAYELVEAEFGVAMRFSLQENATLASEGRFVAPEQPNLIKRKRILGIF